MIHRNEWLLVAFTGSTNIADAVTKVVLPLTALHRSPSPFVVSAVAATLSLPWLVTALYVGVFVDRLDRRALMLGAEAARLAAVGVLLLAYLAGALTLPVIFVAAAVLGVAEVVAVVSGGSIVPSAVPRPRWEKANTRITAMEYLCNGFVGAPVGGLLVAVGFATALGTSALVYALGAGLLALLIGDFRPARRTDRPPVHAEIREGLAFLWNVPLLRTMALLITVLAGCWAAWLALIPVYAVDGPLALDPGRYGVLLTCLGAGGIAGTALVGPVNRLVGRRWSMFLDIVGSFALVATPAVLPAAPGSVWGIGAAAFLAGAGGTMWTVNARLLTQSFVPAAMLGRYIAASRLVSWGMTPIAALAAGALAQAVGFRTAFAVFAVLCLALAHPFLRVVTADAVAAAVSPVLEPAPTASCSAAPVR
ncbi:MFS transporter [Catenulispora subtropica]|uniref:MFS transporter n=1 Tax=Catenulispora subtropica TaxID=450798 RepID=A0ABP5EMA5_9ACTN